MNKLFLFVGILLLATSCGKPPQCGGVNQPGCQGPAGETGPQGPAGKDASIDIIDPCGDMPSHPDEVILRLSPSTLIAYFKENTNNEFLASLELGGSYVTTDEQACQFTITAEGQVVDENGDVF